MEKKQLRDLLAEIDLTYALTRDKEERQKLLKKREEVKKLITTLSFNEVIEKKRGSR